MPLIIPTGFAQVAYVHQRFGDPEPMIVTMGHNMSFVYPEGEQAPIDYLAQEWAQVITAVATTRTTFTGCVAYYGQGPDNPPIVGTSTNAPVAGVKNEDILPQNCATLVRKRSDLGGKRGRGRIYFPEVIENEVSDVGVLSNAYLLQLQQAFTEFLLSCRIPVDRSYTVPPVILHRSEGAGVEPAPTPIHSLVVDTRIATQRRRLRR